MQSFATALLLQDKKNIADFEAERQQLIGLRSLLGMIDSDIEVGRKAHEQKAGTATKK